MTERPPIARWRDKSGVLIAALVLTALCWIVGNPRSSGPDEPSHMVASAGLVRGDRTGRVDPNPTQPGAHLFEVPGMVGQPDPGCWAFKSDVPVACASTVPLNRTTHELPTTSYNYPPWAYVLPGLASFAPTAGGYAYLARLFNAAIPVALVAASLITLVRRRAVAAASLLLGLTPIVWFTFGFVSPSAVAIGAGVALWTGLLFHRPPPLSSVTTWLTVAGWACVLVARRDGPVWAVLIVSTCCLLTSLRPSQLLLRLPRWARWAVVAVLPLPLVTPLINTDTDLNLVIALAPVTLVAVELLARWWSRLTTTTERIVLVAGAALAAALGAVVLVVAAPGGVGATRVREVVSSTSRHVRELVGVLGWLDTPVPFVAVVLFWAAVGGLAMVAAVEYRRAALVFLAGLGAAIVVAWLLQLGQSAEYGNYQGRYTMPFAVGLPVVLAWRPDATEWLGDRLTAVVAWSSWVVSNVAFVAAQQRWGVGINGTWNPMDWDTWGAPVAPWLLLIVHGGATAALATCCTSERVRVLT